jgi:molybdopterin-guanine dinucleotide biosynthesis protein A
VTAPWTAIVLTGGTSTRLGTDKSRIVLGKHTTLQTIVTELHVPTIVVGPEDQGLPVTVVREDPIGSGPAAGLAAALPHVKTELVGVLATDMPFAVPVLIELIDQVTDDVDGCIAVDENGRDQYLCGAYRTSALKAVLGTDPAGRSMRSVIAALAIDRVSVSDHGRLLDIDTPEDLTQAQMMEANNASVD